MQSPSLTKYRNQPYARNPWVLQPYQGRLYLGVGNSSNYAPDKNAGPVPILSINLGNDEVINEGEIPEEQIDHYRVINGQLIIPGHDPTKNDYLRIYLRQPDGSWQHENIAECMGEPTTKLGKLLAKRVDYRWVRNHLYDVVQRNGQTHYAMGIHFLEDKASRVDESELRVPSKTLFPLSKPAWRIYRYYQHQGRLFAVGEPSQTATYLGLGNAGHYRFDNAKQKWSLANKGLFLRLNPKKATARCFVPTKNGVYYLAGHKHNDHQFLPQKLGLIKGKRYIELPEFRAGPPWDIKECSEGKVYVLFNTPLHGGYLATVKQVVDTQLIPYRSITLPTLARSFAVVGEKLYLGLGCEYIKGQWVGNPDHSGEIRTV